jgi:hypothetical protein
MGAIPPRGDRLVHQLEIRLVHHGRGAEGVVGALGLQPLVRDAPQVVINERNQLLERRSIAGGARREQTRDLTWRTGWITGRRGSGMSVRRHE